MPRPSTLLLNCLLLLSAASTAEVAWAAAGQLQIRVVDRDTKQPIACRMHLLSQSGKPVKAPRAPFWYDHFVFDGTTTLKLPLGNYTFELERGPEYLVRSGYFTINDFADDTKEVDMKRFVDMAAQGWWSGDLYVRRPPSDIELLMKADDLHLAQVVTWWNDRSDWSGHTVPKEPLVCFDKDRFYHLSAGGHARAGTTLLYLNLPSPLPVAASGDEYPPSMHYLQQARRQPGAWIDLTAPFWWDLPMLVANGQVDSIELAHDRMCRQSVHCDEDDGRPRDKLLFPPPTGNARWSQEIYFRLLNCGLRIPPSAGSGSGVAPNPVGYNRIYVHADGPLTYEKWFEGLRAGQVVVTNGPLLFPSVEGQLPGHVFTARHGERLEFEIGLTLSTREPISYLELIKNGQVEHSIRFDEYAKSGKLPKLEFERSGWFLVRAVTDLPKTYRFAMTGPYYVNFDYQPRISKSAAEFFLDWVYQRARQIDLADPAQRNEALAPHRKARDFWQALLARANAD